MDPANRLLFLIGFSLMALQPAILAELTQLRGTLLGPSHSKRLPQFTVLFSGKQTTTDADGFFSFPLDHIINPEGLTLVICESAQAVIEKKNTLKQLALSAHTSHKVYRYRKGTYGRHGWFEEKEGAVDYMQSIILLTDPNTIETITPWNIGQQQYAPHSPKIIFKESLSQKQLRRLSTQSLLSALDLKPFHEEVTIHQKKPATHCNVEIAQAK